CASQRQSPDLQHLYSAAGLVSKVLKTLMAFEMLDWPTHPIQSPPKWIAAIGSRGFENINYEGTFSRK
ncbi:MAG: hypothetical protein CL913_00290, partial [Deltaproteobacteria bacterium]|nr:hypothetical protein [Deltaproteobacteria bacterium]